MLSVLYGDDKKEHNVRGHHRGLHQQTPIHYSREDELASWYLLREALQKLRNLLNVGEEI